MADTVDTSPEALERFMADHGHNLVQVMESRRDECNGHAMWAAGYRVLLEINVPHSKDARMIVQALMCEDAEGNYYIQQLDDN